MNNHRMTAKRMNDVIEKMVRQEIRNVLAENEGVIKEMVRTSLLPDLKAAIRDSVYDALEGLTEGATEPGNPPTDNPDVPKVDREAQEPEEALSSEPGSRPSALRNPHSALCAPHSALGRYLYCIADSSEGVSLGNIGIEENEVYSIRYSDLCAVVHNCSARPYASEDPEIVKGWVMAHQKVVDAAWEKFGTVIPIGFDTIIQGDAGADPEANMKKWLQDDYDNLKGKMEKVRGKAEYGLQILWDKRTGTQKIADESPEIKNLRNDIQSKPRGLAYMYRQKLEALLRKEIENRVDRYFREFYEKIAPHADDIRVEKTRETDDEDKEMLLNLSCLLPKEGSHGLGDELEKINALEGFSVRYTGPWPPYSFV
jgi:hypothetical protein